MIHDVDESLRALTRRDVVNGSNVEVSFEAPTKDWAARRNTPTINLYLYDITEDLDRRRVQYEPVRDDHGMIVGRRLPPRRFKLSYIVTCWTQRPEDEHRLLSSMLTCFLREDILPFEVLQGSLVDVKEPIKLTIGLPLGDDKSLSDVWSALGGELKPCLDLVLTVPFDTQRHQPVGPLVLEEPRFTFVRPTGKGTLTMRGRSGVPAAVTGAGAPGDGEETAGGRKRRGKKGVAAETGDDAAAATPTEAEIDWETVKGGKDERGRTMKFRPIGRDG